MYLFTQCIRLELGVGSLSQVAVTGLCLKSGVSLLGRTILKWTQVGSCLHLYSSVALLVSQLIGQGVIIMAL